MTKTPDFAVIGGDTVQRVLANKHNEILTTVERAYLAHSAGESINPPSYFLRFPDRPESRIIALPASLGGEHAVDGVKWISSFPNNLASGLPRASAVLILNDPKTGFPLACLESSVISATRTAASAALAARALHANRARPRRVVFFGTGLIARYIHTFLRSTGWEFDSAGVFDLSTEYAGEFREYLRASGETTVTHSDAESAIRESDLVVFSTTAGTPHVHDPSWFSHNPTVLHISLRDLAPEIVLAATNVVDDVEHCLKADTSPHLTEQRTGSREFLDGALADVLRGELVPPQDKPVIFTPFGLGILDLAVGRYVYDETARAGELATVPGFFSELNRY